MAAGTVPASFPLGNTADRIPHAGRLSLVVTISSDNPNDSWFSGGNTNAVIRIGNNLD